MNRYDYLAHILDSDRTDPGAVFWTALTPDEQQALADLSQEQLFHRDEPLMRIGEPPICVMVIQSGFAKVLYSDAERTDCLVTVIGPGNLVGEFEAIDGGRRRATIVALDETRVYRLSTRKFLDFIEEHRHADLILKQSLISRFREVNRMPLSMASRKPSQRLALLLLDLLSRYGTDGPEGRCVTVPLTQEEIANWVGVNRQIVNKLLGSWRSEGILRVALRQVTVLDADRLLQQAYRRSIG
ncbi:MULTISPECIES: Crp/Fnr family transcriptional regulator [unclassified Nonomuraea]|uniref:Crp/Fnr family transcriptional regulator n=1 Tax=unclassified Nonomuraea TaxID=2593643 RepID=UPI0033E5FD0A